MHGLGLTLPDAARAIDATLVPLVRAGRLEGPVGVAVSGGSDSLALLIATTVWARTTGRTIVALSVDHGMRSDARRECALAAGLAARLGVAHRTLGDGQARPDTHSQASARRFRYARLGEALRRAQGTVLLTGHTRTDQAETVFMRSARGGRLHTLAAMRRHSILPVWPEGRDIVLARPFLHFDRTALMALLRDLGVGWASDPSNAHPRYERSRVRALLSSAPDLAEAVLRSQRVAARRRTLEDKTRGAALSLASVDAAGVCRMPVHALSSLSPPQARATVLADLIRFAAGSDASIRPAAIGRLISSVDTGLASVVTLAGARIWVADDQLCLSRDRTSEPEFSSPLADTGLIWDGRFEIGFEAGSDLMVRRIDPTVKLPDACRDALRRLPRPARDSQPGLFDRSELVASPTLVSDGPAYAVQLAASRLSLTRALLSL